MNDQYIKPFDNIQIFSLLLQLCGTDDIDVNVDADLKFWKHLIPLGKFSEVSKSMWENYPDSEFNKLWNNYIEETISEKPSATTSSIATSTISPTSSTIHDSTPTSERHPSLGEIIDEVEDTINDILHKIWPSNDKGND